MRIPPSFCFRNDVYLPVRPLFPTSSIHFCSPPIFSFSLVLLLLLIFLFCLTSSDCYFINDPSFSHSLLVTPPPRFSAALSCS